MKALFATGLLALASAAWSQTTVKIDDPWVRGTVAAQKATGAFMRLTPSTNARLVAAQSSVAGVVEIHEMVMDGNVMRMRAVPGIDLPAGQPVDLKPGGYHVMLLDLKRALKDGEAVPVTLVVEGRDGKRETLEVQAPVRPLGAAGGMQHRHGHP